MADFIGTETGETLKGANSDDLLQGLGGDDTLDGGGGLDTLQGGVGNDVYVIAQPDGQPLDLVQEDAGEGIDTIVWVAGEGYLELDNGDIIVNPTALYDMADNVEDLVVQADVGDNEFNGYASITGNALDNRMTAGESYHEGDGTGQGDLYVLAEVDFYGGAGDDTLSGGGGADGLYGGTGADLLVGKVGNADIFGLADSDTLDGGDGADTMIGGDGGDLYLADDQGDVIIDDGVVKPGGPPPGLSFLTDDTLVWSGADDFILPENIEVGELQGGAHSLTGNSGGNSLRSHYGDLYDDPSGSGDARLDGASGDDTLTGSLRNDAMGITGDDTLLGGAGRDVIVGASGDDLLDGGADGDDVHGNDGADSMAGGDGDDWLGGDASADVLSGGTGDDILFGGEGDDVLAGGAGVDAFYGGAGQDVVADFTDGQDWLLAPDDFGRVASIVQDGGDTVIAFTDGATTRLLGVAAGDVTEADFLFLSTGSDGRDVLDGGDDDDFLDGADGNDVLRAIGGSDYLRGGSGSDSLDGGDGADTLDGGGGRDRMTGGAGDDLYLVDNLRDLSTEAAGGGHDTVRAAVSWTLGANVEDLVLGDGGARLSKAGAHDAQPIDGTGNGLDNLVRGSAGANRIDGLAGHDSLYGFDGRDSLNGGDGRDLLDGGARRDVLNGGAGADILIGGRGGDDLNGGGGADRMVYLSMAEGGDRITGFSGADIIDISAIDANAVRAGNQAAHFVAGFGGHAGEAVLTYHHARDLTRFSLDVDGDGQADFQLIFTGQVTADAGWAL